MDNDGEKDDSSDTTPPVRLGRERASSQDSRSTINSMTTSVKVSKKEMKKVQELPSVRYVFSFMLEKLDESLLTKDFKGHKIPEELLNPAKKIKSILVDLYTQMKKADKEATLVSWKTDPEKGPSYLDIEPKSLTEDAVILKSYFDGLNLQKRQEGCIFDLDFMLLSNRMYIRSSGNGHRQMGLDFLNVSCKLKVQRILDGSFIHHNIQIQNFLTNTSSRSTT